MKVENKFREFYIDSEGESNITMNMCRGVMSYNFKNAIHTIEIVAVEQLKAEIDTLKSKIEYANDEIHTLKNKLSVFEGMTFSENQEIEQLKSKLAKAKTALEMASDYMDQHGQDATYYEVIILEIGGEI